MPPIPGSVDFLANVTEIDLPRVCTGKVFRMREETAIRNRSQMTILYIFPHPDDESFGPAPAISSQLRAGHRVHLLTLTKGEATRQREKLGVSPAEMGEIRYKEMKCVEKVLGLNGMKVLDLPDSDLKDMDPIEIEDIVEEEIRLLDPDILVTYAVHGISGFHDHLVTHAVVKRVYCKMRREGRRAPQRLALFTRMGEVDTSGKFRLEASSMEEIDVIEKCNERDMEAFHRSLDCYETYREVIQKSGVRTVVTDQVPFELFRENFDPPLASITEKLSGADNE